MEFKLNYRRIMNEKREDGENLQLLDFYIIIITFRKEELQ